MAEGQSDKRRARERTLKRVPIKEEFVVVNGDHRKAVILAQLEYWQSRVNDFDRFIREKCERERASGEEICDSLVGNCP